MNKKYSIVKEKCECSLFHFYENAAKVAGLNVTDKTKYDCRKICISKPVQDCIWKYYYDKGHSNLEISTLLLQFGPKANLSDKEFIFEIENGFAVEEDY